MTLEKYIEDINKLKSHYELIEDYEECAYYRDLIASVEQRDETAYVKLAFDLKGLKKGGFLKSTNPEYAIKRICHFFSFDSIFEYGMIDLYPCHISFADPKPPIG